MTEGQEYVEQGIGAYEKRRLNRKFAHLDRQARKLGLQLVPKCKERKNRTQCCQSLRHLLLKSFHLRVAPGSVAGVTGACVCDGSGVKWPRVG